MAKKITPGVDARIELESLGLWNQDRPLKLAFFGAGVCVGDFINVGTENGILPERGAVVADPRTISLATMTATELLVQDEISTLHPAEAVAFISNCVSWLKVKGRFTVSIMSEKCSPQRGAQQKFWTPQAIIFVMDALGVLVDYAVETPRGEEKRLIVSGVKPERREKFPARPSLLWRLIAGPLCSLGYLEANEAEAFYARCMAYLGREYAPLSAPNISIHVPELRDNKLKILHTVEFYAPHVGGAQLVVQKISEGLVARGHEVAVATTRIPERSFSELNGVAIHEFDVSGSAATGIFGQDIPKYTRFIQEFPCNIMMNYAAQQWATDLAAALVPQLVGRVNVIAPCGYSALASQVVVRNIDFLNYFRHFLPAFLPAYDGVVYHSAMYQDFEYGTLLKLKTGAVIPNAVDETEFNAPPEVNFREKYGIKERFILLDVANFFEGKGQDDLIDAFRRLNRPDTALVLIGKSGETLSKMREKAAGLKVYFLIDIPRSDTVSAYFSADLFVFSSKLEASPLVILEAKAARLPFVSTDVGNVREWRGGIICQADALDAEVRRLLESPEERKRLGAEGWIEYRKQHTWSVILDRYESLYLNLYRNLQTGSRPGKLARRSLPEFQHAERAAQSS
jgi:glycosyltransferase involved in cell wall biosynthesis